MVRETKGHRVGRETKKNKRGGTSISKTSRHRKFGAGPLKRGGGAKNTTCARIWHKAQRPQEKAGPDRPVQVRAEPGIRMWLGERAGRLKPGRPSQPLFFFLLFAKDGREERV